ncbi:hypothetical protein BDV93DRAFT_400053, partial [Ceratobasidium sp. AG-I]
SAPLHSLVDQQAALVREASLALPGQFTQCTFDLGHIKQAVYLCITCDQERGICSACSIACHGDHEQIELFPKRHFRCDCPTTSLHPACTLKSPAQPPNTENTYGQNFTGGGLFCRCSTNYDVKLERETMVQCLACEDWFHESCLNLRERVPPHPSTALNPSPALETPDDGSDHTSVYSDTDLPPALLPGDSYDALICGSCVVQNPTLVRYAGTPGVRMVVPAPSGEGFVVIGDDIKEEVEVDVGGGGDEMLGAVGTKRRAEDDDVNPPTKRPRASPNPGDDSSKPSASTSASTCLAPPINEAAQNVFNALKASTSDSKLGHGDIFLSAGWRDRWCHCSSCYAPLSSRTYLLQPEEMYEPPQDPDAGLSLEELGMRALETLPRERALDSIRAYNSMRDDLMLYLRPFAESGREVREEDITAFFAQR